MLFYTTTHKRSTILQIESAFKVIQQDSTFVAYCIRKTLDKNAYFIQVNETEPWLPPFVESYQKLDNLSLEEASNKLTALNMSLFAKYNQNNKNVENRYYAKSKKRDIGIYWFPITPNEIGLIVIGSKNDNSFSVHRGFANNSLFYWIKVDGNKSSILYKGSN